MVMEVLIVLLLSSRAGAEQRRGLGRVPGGPLGPAAVPRQWHPAGDRRPLPPQLRLRLREHPGESPGEIWGCALGAGGDSPWEGLGGRGTDAALLSSRTNTASAPPCSGQRGARRCPARAPCGPSGTAAGSAVSGGPECPGGGHSAAVTPCAVHNRQRKRALFAPFQQQVCFASFKIQTCRVRAFPRLRARIC